MRRSPMSRGTKTLERKARLKPRRATQRRSGRVHDEAYLAAVRTLPCYVCSRRAPSEADHQGVHPYGRKADDDTAVPMCGGLLGCHRRRTDGYLPAYRCSPGVDYPDWERADKARMRVWCDAAIKDTRALVAQMKGAE